MQAIRPIDQSAIIANRSRAMIGPMTRTYGASQPAPHDNGNHYGQTKPHSNNGNHYGQTANGRSSFHVTA